MKRLIAFVLCAILILPIATAASTAPAPADAANALHSMGLFQGTLAGRSDAESMALDRSATRLEGLVMFLRLLGKEDVALAAQSTHTFNDVPTWASPYVGYAQQNALTTGVSEHQFGSTEPITFNQYITFLLRAFGYSEKAGDFVWYLAPSAGEKIGLCDVDLVRRSSQSATRGDLAQLSYTALSLTLKDKGLTLAGSLVAQSAVPAETFAALQIPLGTATPEKPIMPELKAVADLTNAHRAEATALDGTPRKTLVLDPALSALAQIRAEEIAELYDHYRPDGTYFDSVFDGTPFDHGSAYENIYSSPTSAEQAVAGWVNSPGHYTNMMKPNVSLIGVGRVGNCWVQLFW